MKNIQVTPQIGRGDLERKMKQAQGFLEKREQVKITLILRGRQKGHQASAVEFLVKLHEDYLKDSGTLVRPPGEGHLFLTYNPASKH